LFSKENVNKILEKFPIDISSTKEIKINDLDPTTRIFKVVKDSPLIFNYSKNLDIGEVYILDTLSGMKIACQPEIVGEELEKLCLDSAKEFVRVIKSMDLFENSKTAILHILRAAPGYQIATAFRNKIPVINIRTRYTTVSYRSHDNTKKVVVINRDYSQVKHKEAVKTVIIPDTYATGRSAEIAINDLFENGIIPEKIILYGFIAIPSLIKLRKLTSKRGIEMISFAIGSVTELAKNNYDMPFYGVDESWYNETLKSKSVPEIRLMGSITDRKVLERYLPFYLPGLDQPGDWSERQIKLFNGKDYETGDVSKHIKNTKKNIQNLHEIYSKHFNKNPLYENFSKLFSKYL
jgi:hypothetical protein